MEASHRLEVLDPTPERHGGKPEDTAPRLDTLEGKTVGLLWNGKALGDVALKRTAELISERVPNVTFKFYSGSMPNSPKLLEDLVKNLRCGHRLHRGLRFLHIVDHPRLRPVGAQGQADGDHRVEWL